MSIQINDQNGKSLGSVPAIGTVSDGVLVISQNPLPPIPPPPTPTQEYFVAGGWMLPTDTKHAPTGAPSIVLYPGQDNAQAVSWQVQPADPNQQSTIVAAVDVIQDGVTLKNPNGGKGRTAVYRLAGQTIPGYRVSNGYVYVKPTAAAKAGDTITLKFVAYDDNGAVIETVSKTLAVLAA